MLAPPGVVGTYAGAVDIGACSRRRQRLVVCPTVERHQVCEAGENAERQDPVLASGNTLAKTSRRGCKPTTIAFCARPRLLQSRIDPQHCQHIETAASEAPGNSSQPQRLGAWETRPRGTPAA